MDIAALLRDGEHFAEKKENQIRVTNAKTGVTVAILTTDARGAINGALSPTVLPDGSTVWCTPGVTNVGNTVVFSPLVIDLICQKITEGGNLSSICKEAGMPTYVTLCAWRRQHSWIDKRLEEARRDRAEFLRDQALDEALQATDKHDTPAQQLKHEALKWAAGVDHEKFNPKAKIDAVLSAPTQIIVQTGISREVHDAGETSKEILPQSSQGSERLLEMAGEDEGRVREAELEGPLAHGPSPELVSGEGGAPKGTPTP